VAFLGEKAGERRGPRRGRRQPYNSKASVSHGGGFGRESTRRSSLRGGDMGEEGGRERKGLSEKAEKENK